MFKVWAVIGLVAVAAPALVSCGSPGAATTTSAATVSAVTISTSSTTLLTTTTTGPTTTTTTGPTIPTTTDYAAMLKAQHPSSESFTNKNWDVVRKDADSHQGAAVDIVGQIADVGIGDEVPSLPQQAGWAYWVLQINRARTTVTVATRCCASPSWRSTPTSSGTRSSSM